MAYEQRSYSGDAADTTLASGISPTSLSFSVTAGTGSGYPTGGAGPFFVSLDWDTTTKAEKIKVTSRSGDVFTIATLADRGLDGTTAVTHATNATVRHCWTAIDATEANKAVSETLGAVTTKGDLLAATGLNALARRGAGADNTILVADSTQPTGLSYKTLAALIGLITGANGTVLTADSGQANGFAFEAAPTAAGNGIYGDGSDGAATLDGTATVAWASKVGSVYTMTRNAYLTSLTINNGVTLLPNGFVPFVNGTLTVNGAIRADGGAASGHTAGTAASVDSTSLFGSVGAPPTGGQITISASGNGVSAGTLARAVGGTGGAGGNGAGGNGGLAGSVTLPAQFARAVATIFRPWDMVAGAPNGWAGGQGGASGGPDGVSATNAGSGGGGAGIILVLAKTLIISATGVISAQGGAGGNSVANNGGGGGGGGGGLIFLAYNSLTNSGSVTVAGGAGGLKTGTGTNGSAGGTGTLVELSNS